MNFNSNDLILITDFRELITIAADSGTSIQQLWDINFHQLEKNYEEVFEDIATGVRNKRNKQAMTDYEICCDAHYTMKLNFWGWSFWRPRVADAIKNGDIQLAKDYMYFAVNMYLDEESTMSELRKDYPDEVDFLEYVEEEFNDQVQFKCGSKVYKTKVSGKWTLRVDRF